MAAAPRLIIVADDLTGAMDVASPLAGRGLSAWVVASANGCTLATLPAADVVSINADSRHLSEERAAQCVRSVMRELVHPDSEILIKKIDSTLRGNVVVETLAMLEASGRSAAVVAPAFPRQGRTLAGGLVHVQGVPLNETSFARDALSPPPPEPLHVLFRRADALAEVVSIGRGRPIALATDRRRQIFVVDSVTDEDLRATLRTFERHLKDALLVGSAGIAEALAEIRFEQAPGVSTVPALEGPLLFVVGSRSEQSEQQASALIEAQPTRIIAAPNGYVDIAAALRATEPVLVLRVTPDRKRGEEDAAEVAQRLGESVATLLERRTIAAVVATGGDTAAAVLQHLSQPVLRVVGTLLPGIPFSRIHAGGREVWFVTKAGGFGSRDTLLTVAHRLRGNA
jgi:D-threonate/D-erythronate kinase